MRVSNQAFTVFACFLMFFWSIGLRMVFFALVPVIASDLGLSTSQAGLLVGVFYLGYSIAVWGSAFIPGRRKPVIIAGALSSLMFLVLLTEFRSFPILLVLAPLCSAGAGIYLPRGIGLLTDASNNRNRGRNLSFHEIAAVLGMVLGPLYVSKMLAHWNWSEILLSWGLVELIALIVLLGVIDNSPPKNTGDNKQQFRPNSLFFSLAGLGGCIFLIIVGLTSVLPIIMVDVWHMAPAFAASYLGLTRISGVLGPLIGGILSDRVGRIKVLLMFFSITLLSIIGIMFTSFGWLFTSCLLVMTMASNGCTPVWVSIVSESYPPAEKDKAIGLVTGSASLLGSVLSPPVFGLLIEHFPISVSFGAAALGTLGGVWILLRLPNILQKQARQAVVVGLGNS